MRARRRVPRAGARGHSRLPSAGGPVKGRARRARGYRLLFMRLTTPPPVTACRSRTHYWALGLLSTVVDCIVVYGLYRGLPFLRQPRRTHATQLAARTAPSHAATGVARLASECIVHRNSTANELVSTRFVFSRRPARRRSPLSHPRALRGRGIPGARLFAYVSRASCAASCT